MWLHMKIKLGRWKDSAWLPLLPRHSGWSNSLGHKPISWFHWEHSESRRRWWFQYSRKMRNGFLKRADFGNFDYHRTKKIMWRYFFQRTDHPWNIDYWSNVKKTSALGKENQRMLPDGRAMILGRTQNQTLWRLHSSGHGNKTSDRPRSLSLPCF